eukprot:TRINITY_DN3487_c0_g1_i9.p1 TRINITY_DN3487_c0_g1~~TRINITY_DN3487_c0_g1_i9.p1  ORF type:complete len:461 (+),score=85.67 TRINITY_DN3487_c0_g1_i9:48-1385(+)
MFGTLSIVKDKKEKKDKKKKKKEKKDKRKKEKKQKRKRSSSSSSGESQSHGEDDFMKMLLQDEAVQKDKGNLIERALGDNRQSRLQKPATTSAKPGSLGSKFTTTDPTIERLEHSSIPDAPETATMKDVIDEKGTYKGFFVPDHLRSATVKEFEALLAKGKQQQENRDKQRLKKQKSDTTEFPAGGDDLMAALASDRREEVMQKAKRSQQQDKSAHQKLGGPSAAICYGSDEFSRDNLISMGDKTMMMLPVFTAVTNDQCYLTTIEPRVSSLEFDEHEATEIRNFQKCLIQKAADDDCGMIFSECVMNLNEQRQTFIECIPVPNDVFYTIEPYFYKALDEAEDEFNQTHKRVITTRGKSLRSCVPANMPYYSVSFNLDGGYAHVIHTQSAKFRYLTVDICGGLLGFGMNGRLSAEERKRLIGHDARVEFRRSWDKYDWTKMLDEC